MSPQPRRRWLIAFGAAAVAVSAGGYALGSRSGEPPDVVTVEVAERGALVMPFELERTTHVFTPTDGGGVQTVVADDADDERQARLVREHLREEARRFARGDFSDPRSIHGAHMPGLATLEARADELDVRFEPTRRGARIVYTSDDPEVVEALHEWFAAQVSDHGEHAQGG